MGRLDRRKGVSRKPVAYYRRPPHCRGRGDTYSVPYILGLARSKPTSQERRYFSRWLRRRAYWESIAQVVFGDYGAAQQSHNPRPYPGINYAGRWNRTTNRDEITGIRYGIVSAHLLPYWHEEAETIWPEQEVPEEAKLWFCESCDQEFPNDQDLSEFDCPDCVEDAICGAQQPRSCVLVEPDEYFDEFLEADGSEYSGNGYEMRCGSEDADVWVFKSPYYTYGCFCSPCAPGACTITAQVGKRNRDNKCYCPGPEWFEEGQCPINIWSVETGKLVKGKDPTCS